MGKHNILIRSNTFGPEDSPLFRIRYEGSLSGEVAFSHSFSVFQVLRAKAVMFLFPITSSHKTHDWCEAAQTSSMEVKSTPSDKINKMPLSLKRTSFFNVKRNNSMKTLTKTKHKIMSENAPGPPL